MPKGICPYCDGDVHVDVEADKGELVTCEDCGSYLEIVGLDPVELDVVEDLMDEDYEDDDEY